ncbi:hypothetical protein OB955_15095 [Halobacteria archaeon AArc-m2/3/4]|uniref:Endo-beta-1,6-galactanase-like domain-containing protein n=1 Tax=Natronoglomus mannanivorans TaxID=2979990 RepID=A0AAP3E409_9EURY|nr:hypothetical protein [Halobacteria archaeon AArc-xg1-1]MCU4974054.1 hypothetical protein [Halobacteria archaeon AArc-m2/3/4]
MVNGIADVEVRKLHTRDGDLVATLHLHLRDSLEDVKTAVDVTLEEVYYQRNDRGTSKIREGRSREATVLGEELREQGAGGQTLHVEIRVPEELATAGNYRDGRVDTTLTVEKPDEDRSTVLTADGTPIFLGEPEFTIDPDTECQPIDGFGASGAWWAQNVGGWEDQRDSIADFLFTREKGIGLSIYRYNAMGGVMSDISNEWRTGETYEVAEREYDWSRDENARWVLQAANDRGVENFILFTKTPPARITRNNKTYADHGVDSNLDPEMYEQFARYLADITAHFRREEGIEFDWVSPINEPEWDWEDGTQEGSPYTVAQVLELSKTILAVFDEENVRADLLLPEAGSWDFISGNGRNYADRLLTDPVLGDTLSVLAAHSYWSSDEERAEAGRAMATYPETRIWQTEWCEMEPGRDLGMDFALDLVNTVHSDLTIAGASSWQFWLSVSKVDYTDGLIYVDTDTRDVTPAKALWAFGNYTRFIRPGAVRIDTESNYEHAGDVENKSGVSLSAYLGPEREELVIVAINEVDSETTATIAIESEMDRLVLTPHRTSHEESLDALDEITIESTGDDVLEGNVELAPRSVTTFTGVLSD